MVIRSLDVPSNFPPLSPTAYVGLVASYSARKVDAELGHIHTKFGDYTSNGSKIMRPPGNSPARSPRYDGSGHWA